MRKRPKALPKPERVGINIRLPSDVHRSAKVACAGLGMTWDEAAAEAFTAWARERMPQTK